jgi:nitrite reductase (NADH) small subunit
VAQVEVCRLADLPEAVPKVVQAGERELVLVRWRGEVYALRNVCPHMSSSFDRGSVIGRVTGEVGEVRIESDEPLLTCPWHQYEFSLANGRCGTDDKLRVRTYRVDVEDGRILVDLARHRATKLAAPNPGGSS